MADTSTAVMLQILKEMQEQWRADQKRLQEQRRADQERLQRLKKQRLAAEERPQRLQNQRIAAKEKRRSDIQRILRGLHTGRTPAVANTSPGRFPLAKGEYNGYKVILARYYFCNGLHKPKDCLHRAESAVVSVPGAA